MQLEALFISYALHLKILYQSLNPKFMKKLVTLITLLLVIATTATADELVVEFALTKYVKQASAGSYITKPVSFVVDTGASGMKYTVTQISSEDKAKIVETYNNFKLNPASKPDHSTNYFYVEINWILEKKERKFQKMYHIIEIYHVKKIYLELII